MNMFNHLRQEGYTHWHREEGYYCTGQVFFLKKFHESN